MGSVGTLFQSCCLLETTTFRFLYRRVPIAPHRSEGSAAPGREVSPKSTTYSRADRRRQESDRRRRESSVRRRSFERGPCYPLQGTCRLRGLTWRIHAQLSFRRANGLA